MSTPMNCPCGSEISLDQCCLPYIDGVKKAPNPEALMRSRYTAYVIQKIPYLAQTLHPSERDDFDEASVAKWSRESDWLGLEIKATTGGTENDKSGTVEFIARFKQEGIARDHHELAEFKKQDGQWFFVDGKLVGVTQVKRETPKIGRNDPCTCGSGKKFKKCCGK